MQPRRSGHGTTSDTRALRGLPGDMQAIVEDLQHRVSGGDEENRSCQTLLVNNGLIQIVTWIISARNGDFQAAALFNTSSRAPHEMQ